jgi:hypothetical protein
VVDHVRRPPVEHELQTAAVAAIDNPAGCGAVEGIGTALVIAAAPAGSSAGGRARSRARSGRSARASRCRCAPDRAGACRRAWRPRRRRAQPDCSSTLIPQVAGRDAPDGRPRVIVSEDLAARRSRAARDPQPRFDSCPRHDHHPPRRSRARRPVRPDAPPARRPRGRGEWRMTPAHHSQGRP